MSAKRIFPTEKTKRGTLVHLLKKHRLRIFIETGTFRGDTALTLSLHADRVWTIELDQELWGAAREKCGAQPNIHCLHGCSGEVLGDVLMAAGAPALLWLDGHYSGAGTAVGRKISPLLEELEHVIGSAHAARHVMLIDDVRLFGSQGYPDMDELVELLRLRLPEHSITCHRDMMFVEPPVDRMRIPADVAASARKWEAQPLASEDGSYFFDDGPCYDAEAAWREGFNDMDLVSAIRVTRCCRFGNSVRQVANAFRVAERYGLRTIYLPGMWWLASCAHDLSNGMRLVNSPGVCFDDEEVILSGEFFNLRRLLGFSAATMNDREALRWLEPVLMIQPEVEPLGDDHLVIHVRGGDVFMGKAIHRGYGQPPLAYYLRVLDLGNWTKVTIVGQDQTNPVWTPLVDACMARIPCVVRVGMPLAEDVAFLMRARTIVTGRGTFIRGIGVLSKHLRRVHDFEGGFADWGGGGVEVVAWQDDPGVYRDGLLCGNWVNAEWQRALMVDYPVDAIRMGGAPAPETGPQSSSDGLR
jgi:hypothetical protein